VKAIREPSNASPITRIHNSSGKWNTLEGPQRRKLILIRKKAVIIQALFDPLKHFRTYETN